MPCYDKKLEAVRPTFKLLDKSSETIIQTPEVDTVLATHELIDLFSSLNVDFLNQPELSSEREQSGKSGAHSILESSREVNDSSEHFEQ